jgi:hypothetical protein
MRYQPVTRAVLGLAGEMLTDLMSRRVNASHLSTYHPGRLSLEDDGDTCFNIVPLKWQTRKDDWQGH